MCKVLTWIYAVAIVIVAVTFFGSLLAYINNNLDAALVFAWICAPAAIVGAIDAIVKERLFK